MPDDDLVALIVAAHERSGCPGVLVTDEPVTCSEDVRCPVLRALLAQVAEDN